MLTSHREMEHRHYRYERCCCDSCRIQVTRTSCTPFTYVFLDTWTC